MMERCVWSDSKSRPKDKKGIYFYFKCMSVKVPFSSLHYSFNYLWRHMTSRRHTVMSHDITKSYNEFCQPRCKILWSWVHSVSSYSSTFFYHFYTIDWASHPGHRSKLREGSKYIELQLHTSGQRMSRLLLWDVLRHSFMTVLLNFVTVSHLDSGN